MTERLFLRLEGDPLYAPETDVPVGTMREFAVRAPLRGHVAAIAVYREIVPPGHELTERVLPDGAVHLIFNLGEPPRVGAGAGRAEEVAGPTAAPAVLRLRGRIEGVSVTLRPGAASALLGLPVGELSDRAVGLDELWPAAVSSALRARLAEARGDAARVAIVQAALHHRLRAAASDAANARQAARALHALTCARGPRPLREAAEAIGVGERRLQQIFHAEVGLSPRAWRRLARMHACLRALRGDPAPRWPELALEAGFYDQAHLANEFQALCGLSPTLFLARRASGSSKTPR